MQASFIVVVNIVRYLWRRLALANLLNRAVLCLNTLISAVKLRKQFVEAKPIFKPTKTIHAEKDSNEYKPLKLSTAIFT